ncbi:hypothetical protein D3C73_1066930 [compost metagenome]
MACLLLLKRCDLVIYSRRITVNLQNAGSLYLKHSKFRFIIPNCPLVLSHICLSKVMLALNSMQFFLFRRAAGQSFVQHQEIVFGFLDCDVK